MPPNKSLQVSRDCVPFIKSLFSKIDATRAATLTLAFSVWCGTLFGSSKDAV